LKLVIKNVQAMLFSRTQLSGYRHSDSDVILKGKAEVLPDLLHFSSALGDTSAVPQYRSTKLQ